METDIKPVHHFNLVHGSSTKSHSYYVENVVVKYGISCSLVYV